MNLREAAQQALEALENFNQFRQIMTDGPDTSDKLMAEDYAEMAFLQGVKSIAALRAALAEPQTTHWEGCEAVHPECQGREQEPVAWLYRDAWGTMKLSQTLPPPVGAFPVYTAPTPRKPLHDMAVFDLADEHLYEGGKNYGILAFARAIEKAHGIGDQT